MNLLEPARGRQGRRAYAIALGRRAKGLVDTPARVARVWRDWRGGQPRRPLGVSGSAWGVWLREAC
jgi:hypothetical protein